MSSPAGIMFEDQSVKLSGGRWRDEKTKEWNWTEVILYIDYKFAEKCIRFSIHSDVTRKTELDIFADNLGSVAFAIKQVNATYPGKLKAKKLLHIAEIFFEAVKGSVSVSSQVTDTTNASAYEACGSVDKDAFAFLYVPEVPGSVLIASVSLRWEFGCGEGIQLEGALDDVGAEARETLQRMLSMASDDYKPQVEKALRAL